MRTTRDTIQAYNECKECDQLEMWLSCRELRPQFDQADLIRERKESEILHHQEAPDFKETGARRFLNTLHRYCPWLGAPRSAGVS